MGRKPRVVYSGALYHIIQRGNNRNYIYEDIRDKRKFFELLLEAREACGFQILYYVLMDNHYHLVLEAGETPIWKAIQKLNVAYSKYYNQKYNRSGSIYGGRYTAYVVKDSKYYYQVLKYIAQNPVKAGIVKTPEEYRWSAHWAIRSGKTQVVNLKRALSYFPGSEQQAKQSYLDLIEQDKEITSEYGLLPMKEAKKVADALQYLLKTMDYPEDTRQRILRGDKRVSIKQERDAFIRAAYGAGFAAKDIALFLSFSPEGVRKVLRG